MNDSKPQKTTAADAQSAPARIVGIGASAGGLEAIKELFDTTPSDTGISWVIVQHLSPDYKSVMGDLLTASTTMAIHEATAGIAPQPDNIYLIPSSKDLRLDRDGKFTLENQDRGHSRPNLPINIFFESLAQLKGKDAIGVVLSGTGSDGTRGARAIREYNGIVLVQSPESAKFDGMPKSIIENDLADFIDTPKRLTANILNYIRHPLTQQKLIGFIGEDKGTYAPLAAIFAILKNRFSVDFSLYKGATIGRRIERRITKCQKDSLEDYAHYISSAPEEAEALLQELLIGVTSFYRDVSVFNQIQMTHLPQYLDSHSLEGEFRCWVAGCSTGEEAYSLAIILTELLEQRQSMARVKIFATDLNARAIARASAGIYPKSIANDLPADLISKYFKSTKDHFVVNRSIREKVVFAKHDVINDPPFTRIDLVSCRNMLIYFDTRAQHKVLTSFSFALNDQGLLLLGDSESLGEAQDLYEVVDKPNKLFKSVGKAQGISLHMKYAKSTNRFDTENAAQFKPSLRDTTSAQLREELRVYESLLDNLPQIGGVSFGLLLNNRNEVLRVIGTSSSFLKPLSGTIDNSLRKLLNEPLHLPVSSALMKAFAQSKVVKMRRVNVNLNGEDKSININVLPLSTHPRLFNHALITLSEEISSSELPEHILIDAEVEVRHRIEELENELQITRENLQSTIEDLETSNEELQATNEELLASNEELQSTNEELQSVNEELFTINNEHQDRVYQMTRLSTDYSSVLAAARISTVMLDSDLRIRSFSSEAVRVFNLIDKDEGHHINRISHHLGEIDVEGLAQKVQKTGERLSQQVAIPRLGDYRLTFGPVDHQEIGERTGVAILIQGPLD